MNTLEIIGIVLISIAILGYLITSALTRPVSKEIIDARENYRRTQGEALISTIRTALQLPIDNPENYMVVGMKDSNTSMISVVYQTIILGVAVYWDKKKIHIQFQQLNTYTGMCDISSNWFKFNGDFIDSAEIFNFLRECQKDPAEAELEEMNTDEIIKTLICAAYSNNQKWSAEQVDLSLSEAVQNLLAICFVDPSFLKSKDNARLASLILTYAMRDKMAQKYMADTLKALTADQKEEETK